MAGWWAGCVAGKSGDARLGSTEPGYPWIKGTAHSLNAPVGVPKAVLDKLYSAASQALRHRQEVKWEPIWDPATIDDEMNAQMLRLGAGQTVAGPDPKRAAGYYVFVVNGSMVHKGQDLPRLSPTVVEPNEEEFEITAGDRGLEALVLEFPLDYE